MNKKVIIFITIIVAILVIVFIVFKLNYKVSDDKNPISAAIENNSVSKVVLTKENFEDTMKKYGETVNQNSDEYLYVAYAEMYYIMKDGMASAFDSNLTDEQKQDASYKNIYGKTINQLEEEGKKMMAENNVTPQQWKESMQNQTTN